MRSPYPLAAAVVAFAIAFTFPSAGQATGENRRTIGERVRELEAKQEEIAKALAALRVSLDPATPAASADELRRRLEHLEAVQVETNAALETLRKETERRAPGPVEPTGLATKSFPLLGSSAQVSSGTSFNPSISVIPNFVYYRDSRQGMALEIVEEADGFQSGSSGSGHGPGTLNEGFNLGETELAFTASVDPYFDAVALFAAGEGGLEAEEVYLQTRRLPAGLRLKAGKFLSGFGYANRQHPHQWDFVDQGLAYDLLLGGDLNEKGVQATWLPKLPFYVQLGAELLQGENERVASYLGPQIPNSSAGSGSIEPVAGEALSRKAGPRLFTGFLKVSPNIGYDDALQVGVSYARSTLHQEIRDEDGDGRADEALEGSVDLWGGDVVFKHDSPREYGAGDLVLQAEYLLREKALDGAGSSRTARFRQDGASLQAVYGLAPRFQVAARCDVAGLTSSAREGATEETFGTSKRWSGALTFNPTEFSRIRAQYDRGEIRVGGETKGADQLFLQLQLSIGAHGAHSF